MREGKIGAGRESLKPGLGSTRWVAITASLVYDAWMQAVRAAERGKSEKVQFCLDDQIGTVCRGGVSLGRNLIVGSRTLSWR